MADGRIQQSSSGPFSAVSAARTMYVSRVSFEDKAGPSRVTDLAVRLVDQKPETLVNISWTAPGGDLDQGAGELQLSHATNVANIIYFFSNRKSIKINEYCPETNFKIKCFSPASRYELKMYTERVPLTEERFNESGILVFCVVDGLSSLPPPPAIYGSSQYCLTKVPFADLKW